MSSFDVTKLAPTDPVTRETLRQVCDILGVPFNWVSRIEFDADRVKITSLIPADVDQDLSVRGDKLASTSDQLHTHVASIPITD